MASFVNTATILALGFALATVVAIVQSADTGDDLPPLALPELVSKSKAPTKSPVLQTNTKQRVKRQTNAEDVLAAQFLAGFYAAGNPSPKPIETFLTTTASPLQPQPSLADATAAQFLNQFYQAGNPSPKPIETFLTSTASPPAFGGGQQSENTNFQPMVMSESDIAALKFLSDFYAAGNPSPKPIETFLTTTTTSSPFSAFQASSQQQQQEQLSAADIAANKFVSDFYAAGNPGPKPIETFLTTTTTQAPPGSSFAAFAQSGSSNNDALSAEDAAGVQFLRQFYTAGNPSPKPIETFLTTTQTPSGSSFSAFQSSSGSNTLSAADSDGTQFLQQFYAAGNPSPKPIETFLTTTTTQTPGSSFSAFAQSGGSSNNGLSAEDAASVQFLQQFYAAGNPSPKPIETFLTTTTTSAPPFGGSGSNNFGGFAQQQTQQDQQQSSNLSPEDAAGVQFLQQFYSAGNPSPKPIEAFLTTSTTQKPPSAVFL